MKEHGLPQRFPDSDTRIPRFREAGEVTLDLINRDGRVADCWLGFDPGEFELLWRLAETPGKRMTHSQLLRDVWRVGCHSGTGGLAVLVARLRAKLAPFGLSRMIARHAEGGYFLDTPTGPCSFGLALAPPA